MSRVRNFSAVSVTVQRSPCFVKFYRDLPKGLSYIVAVPFGCGVVVVVFVFFFFEKKINKSAHLITLRRHVLWGYLTSFLTIHVIGVTGRPGAHSTRKLVHALHARLGRFSLSRFAPLR